ncbi:hypothetical protein SAMN05444422_101553 [Halobiforma haloterrestris]|uniref:NAD operon protein n=1 Tax=Natronobacterium haloterrestre TaxID=148448 RepID=A0A1I1DEA0_NATHA|nr:SAM-dependent chlorinase/fluorinase [Halobiforma haloterrestris]SFB73167.1 hypothetical protein SAMN05444422_101553 [Halobiforma haloterrestris]
MITLTSDFGTPYPAAMKGVVLQRTASEPRLVDIGHDFPRQDVRAAAFWLREVLPYYPPATHLVVVDPGVGTDRNALVVRAGDHVLVGPDNGVLRPPARRLAAEDEIEAYVVDETVLESPDPAGGAATVPTADAGPVGPASNTFHGRDVFAPAAADVHGLEPDALETVEFLSPTDEWVDLEFPEPTVSEDRATGEVLVVDDFGNAITNVPGSFLEDRDRIAANDEIVPVGETFAAVGVGERLATVGSHGYVELDVNQGRGDEAFGLAVGDRVVLEGLES